MLDIYDGVVSLKDKYLLPDESGLYFIAQDNKIIYIGQSIHIQTRIITHHRLVQFEKLGDPQVYWLLAPAGKLNQLEKVFIEKLKPQLNGTKIPIPRPKKPTVPTRVSLTQDQIQSLDNLSIMTGCITNTITSISLGHKLKPSRTNLIRLIAEGAKIGIVIELIKLIREDKQWLIDNSGKIIEYIHSIRTGKEPDNAKADINSITRNHQATTL